MSHDTDTLLPAGALPDRHGEAALLLVESLIHGLISRSSLTVSEAVDVVQVAIDVEDEIFRRRGVDSAESHLTSIVVSLRIDDPRSA